MIRILHVVSSLNINAGMMSVVMNYYRHIDRNQVQFDFLYFSEMEDNHRDEILKMGGRVFYMPNPSFSFKYQKQLRVFFSDHEGEYTIVHCHPIWASEIIAREAKRSGIKHIIQHCHSTQYSSKKKSAIRNKALMHLVGFFATDFVACSEEAALLFGKKLVKSGKVNIVRNAIDLDKYKFDEQLRREFREELDISDSTFVIGSVGRLCVEKNQKFIIDVFDLYVHSNPNSKLLIVGGGGLKTELEKYINATESRSKIVLVGKRNDIQKVLSGFDLFIMPSIFEGVPLSAVEAQANGLQVLISDNITKSISTSKTTYVSLSDPAIEWEKCIELCRRKRNNRRDNYEIAQLGFDINEEAQKLKAFYFRLASDLIQVTQ